MNNRRRITPLRRNGQPQQYPPTIQISRAQHHHHHPPPPHEASLPTSSTSTAPATHTKRRTSSRSSNMTRTGSSPRNLIASFLLLMFGCASLLFLTFQMLCWVFLTSTHGYDSDYSYHNFFNLEHFFEHPHLPVIIIGGTDGSGTRAFVDTIKQLGVPIVADDPKTFDVHAAEVFQKRGWPALVNTVLEHTHSANYEWEDLPQASRDILSREIPKFLKGLDLKYGRQKQYALGRSSRQGISSSSSSSANSDGDLAAPTLVSFGIKAPVAMLVLPVLSQFMGKIKFVHVLRDGRDIALSNNQSPVLKFYNTTYPDHENRTKLYNYKDDLWNVRGMQLWNDWNLQVRQWATQQPNTKIEYLAMRSEDLLDPSKRYACLQTLAEYVGSPLLRQEDSSNSNSKSNSKICCLSQTAAQDFGVSAFHNEHRNNFRGGGGGASNSNNNNNNHGRGHGKFNLAGATSLFYDASNPHKQQDDDEFDNTQSQLEALRQEEANLKKIDSSLKQREKSLQKIDQDLQAREDLLRKLQTSLQDLEESLRARISTGTRGQHRLALASNQTNDNHNDNANSYHHREGGERRRLQQHQPKLVPSQFVKDFSNWKESVELHADEMQLETLYKLQKYGENLGGRWQKNSQALIGVVDIFELEALLKHLKLKIQHKTKGGGGGGVEVGGESSHNSFEVLKKRANAVDVHQRYGKWQKALENRTKLSEYLHREGQEALRVFGYEPRLDMEYNFNSTFVCNADDKAKVVCG